MKTIYKQSLTPNTNQITIEKKNKNDYLVKINEENRVDQEENRTAQKVYWLFEAHVQHAQEKPSTSQTSNFNNFHLSYWLLIV